jgi:glucose-1-phosphate thymidylyltransferase
VKGIVLAGGAGTRLHPITLAVTKQLLPIYDKPLVYYPLSVLMLAGIRDVLFVTTPADESLFRKLFGDGRKLGLRVAYAAQSSPRGLADAFIVGREFVGNDSVALVLGDNIFYGHGFQDYVRRAFARPSGATAFAYQVREPQHYGVVEFDLAGRPVSLVEKPSAPKSHWAVTGLYFYDNRVLDIASKLKPSPRGELEITDVNAAYMNAGELVVERLGRGIAWLDTGTKDSLLQASNLIQTLEERQGLKVACIEEIAFRMGYIGQEELREIARSFRNSPYGEYLARVADENVST